MWNCRMRSQQFLPIHVGQVEPCFGAATLQPNSCSSYSFRCTVCQLKKLFNRSVQLSPLAMYKLVFGEVSPFLLFVRIGPMVGVICQKSWTKPGIIIDNCPN